MLFAGIAVLGIALIAMGEDIGAEMSFRSFGHLVSNANKHSQSLISYSVKNNG